MWRYRGGYWNLPVRNTESGQVVRKGKRGMTRLGVNKEKFKNHIAVFTDCGNIKILDFKNPNSNDYRIRFLFEEDCYKLKGKCLRK